jgi:hypothetical protein
MEVDVLPPIASGAANGRCGRAVLAGTDTLAGSVATMVDIGLGVLCYRPSTLHQIR